MENKDNLQKFIEGNMTESETDKFVKELVIDKMSTQKKEEYAKDLEEQYGVNKSKFPRKSQYGFLAVILLLITGIGLGYFIMESGKEKVTSVQVAEAYMKSNTLDYSDQFRAAEDKNLDRSAALVHYQNGEFSEAVLNWHKVGEDQLNNTDRLYLAISMLKSSDFENSYNRLKALNGSLEEGAEWKEEASLYFAISCLATNRIEELEIERLSWQPSSWASKEFEKAMNLSK